MIDDITNIVPGPPPPPPPQTDMAWPVPLHMRRKANFTRAHVQAAVTMDSDWELLLEVEQSRTVIKVPPKSENVLKAVNEAAARVNPKAVVVLDNTCTEAENTSSYFVLQRWSTKWNSFVDVKKSSDVNNHDKLKLVPMPRLALGERVCFHR